MDGKQKKLYYRVWTIKNGKKVRSWRPTTAVITINGIKWDVETRDSAVKEAIEILEHKKRVIGKAKTEQLQNLILNLSRV